MNTPLPIKEIAFEVFGEPKPQGSKIPQVIYRKGADGKPVPVMKNGKVISAVREDNPLLTSWRQGIAGEAKKAYDGPLFIGALELDILFERPRPASHFGTGRNAGKLRASAPEYLITKPDNGKLVRAIEDALSGVLYRDDAQFVDRHDRKVYGKCFRTVITVRSIDGRVEEEF